MNRQANRLHNYCFHRGAVARALVAVTLFGLVLASAPPASAADPFYEEQFRHGRRAYELGQLDSAAKALRIAAFGLLEEPDALVEALLYLALSQAGMGDKAAFDTTFERIADLDERFSAYANLVSPQIKAAFEARVVDWITPERLRMTGGFEALARQENNVQVDLRPGAQRRALQRQAVQNPEDATILLELAKLEIEQGRERKALAALDRITSIDPTLVEAHCLRVAVGAAMNRCHVVSSAYLPCGAPSFGAATDLFVLGCLVEAEAWNASRSFLGGLPEPQRGQAPFAALEIQIDQSLQGVEGDLVPPDTSPPDETFETVEQASATQPAGYSSEDAETAARVRELLDSARRPSDLDEPITLATELADRNPTIPDAQFLAAETAYRGGYWVRAVEMFRRGGEPSPEEPLLVFYFAVSLFESGEKEAAAEALQTVLPSLRRTAFVDTYTSRILGE